MNVGLLIIAHAPLASALRAVAQHVYPERAGLLQALDVPPDMGPDEAEAQARVLLAALDTPQALVFTDVFGATPCNVAQRLADGVSVRAVTGVNVPMLWRTLCYSGEALEPLVARALAGATQGAMQLGTARPQNQALAVEPHDQANPQHQQ